MVAAGDVYGALLADALAGRRAMEITERDDGFLRAYDAGYLLAPFARWDDPAERRAMRFVRGRVLDVGCGGGRVSLHLQERGLEVVGIDTSAGAVACCAQRGVRDVRLIAVESLPAALGRFDTVVLLGQNFGMLGAPQRARRLLRRFAARTTARGRVVAETFDPHAPDDPADRRYLERNVARGRMPGHLRVRTRYRDLATPWTDWLQVSPAELAGLVDGTGWQLVRTLHHGSSYVAVLDKR